MSRGDVQAVDDRSLHLTLPAETCHGQACIKGTRIPVHQIIHMLASGDKTEEILGDYPSLKVEGIQAWLEYAAALAEKQLTPILPLTQGNNIHSQEASSSMWPGTINPF